MFAKSIVLRGRESLRGLTRSRLTQSPQSARQSDDPPGSSSSARAHVSSGSAVGAPICK